MGAAGSLDVNTVDKLASANELHVLRKKSSLRVLVCSFVIVF
jgi:hypothetical protein